MIVGTSAVTGSTTMTPDAVAMLRRVRRRTLRLPVGLGFIVVLAFSCNNAARAQTDPDLGTDSTYGLVASTFTNTNLATTVNGDVCFTTPPGTGYTENGTQISPCSAPVGTDQAAALTTLNGEPCNPLGAGAVTLDTVVVGVHPPGTIPPGCYSISGAINITTLSTVTLSGNGVYIFRSTGPLGVGASSAVALTNGAAAAHVYWTPGSAATFGASASFVGTIIADGITFGNLATLTGRALVFSGTVTTDANTISVPAPAPPPPPLFSAPTLSQWALFLFAGMLAAAGFVVVRRRARRAA
jgi:Ice-binding-like/IPTL-CTERM motif